MNPIFDRNSRLVGWINEKDNMIYDASMRWIGFKRNDSIFTNNSNWVGGYYKNTFVDKQGKPVAWLGNHQPCGCGKLSEPLTPLRPLTPLTPLRPLTPLTPLRPPTPLDGWSNLDWHLFWRQNI